MLSPSKHSSRGLVCHIALVNYPTSARKHGGVGWDPDQFQQIWGDREHLGMYMNVTFHRKTNFFEFLLAGLQGSQQILKSDGKRKWSLVTVDNFQRTGYAPNICHKIINHPVFHIMVMTITVLNAFITATISFR